MRGAEQRARMRETLEILAEVRDQLVFLGGNVLALYAAAEGSPLRVTYDIDCFSTVQPWILQAEILARLCSDGTLEPDLNQLQRYRVRSTGLVIDVMSPDGMNVPGDKWLRRAADSYRAYDLGDGIQAKAVAPAYFVVLKLAAFMDRGDDFLSSKDMEDIVFVAAEVPDLIAEIEAAGLRGEIATLWMRALTKHHLSPGDLMDVVDAHLGPHERPRQAAVVAVVKALANPP